MPDAARRIDRLRLTATSDEAVTRGRILVEDAFRIASLPREAERRVLAIRRLELGVVDADRGSAALAPVIEEAVRAAAGRAVRFDDPAAPAADAVYFPDGLAAASGFVEWLVGPTDPTEWFWEAAFGGRVPPGEPETGVRLALERLLDLPGGPARVAMLMDVLRVRGTLDRFLAWLRPTDGVRLLAAFGLNATPDRRSAVAIGRVEASKAEATDSRVRRQDDAPPLLAALQAWRPVIAQWIERWGEHDPRSSWLAVVALVCVQPSLLSHSNLPKLIVGVLRTARSPRVVPGPGPRPSPPSTAKPAPSAAEVERAVRTPGSASPPGGSDVAVSASPPRKRFDQHRPERVVERGISAPVVALLPSGSHAPPREATATMSDLDLHPTAAAGLLFVVPLLSSLGVAQVLAGNPTLLEFSFPQRLLLFIADRLKVLKADAMRIPLRPADPGPPPRGWHRVFTTWLTRVRRVAQRHARIGLRALVARPGQIGFTRTHIDVVLPLSELDIRVRRAGLDADPGWVPWLGRVVTFHYEAEP